MGVHPWMNPYFPCTPYAPGQQLHFAFSSQPHLELTNEANMIAPNLKKLRHLSCRPLFLMSTGAVPTSAALPPLSSLSHMSTTTRPGTAFEVPLYDVQGYKQLHVVLEQC